MWNSQQIVCVGNCCLNQITRRADQWRKWRCSCFLSIALQRLAHSAVLGIGICAKRTIDAIIAHAGSNCCSHHLGVLSSRMVDLAIHQLQKHACMTQPRQCNRYDMLSESQCFSLVFVFWLKSWLCLRFFSSRSWTIGRLHHIRRLFCSFTSCLVSATAITRPVGTQWIWEGARTCRTARIFIVAFFSVSVFNNQTIRKWLGISHMKCSKRKLHISSVCWSMEKQFCQKHVAVAWTVRAFICSASFRS